MFTIPDMAFGEYQLIYIYGVVFLLLIIVCGIATCCFAPSARQRAQHYARHAALQLQQLAVHQVQVAQQSWGLLQQEVLQEVARHPRPARPALPGQPDPTSVVPPLYLYHGTARGNLAGILVRGIEGRTAGWAFSSHDYQVARSYGVSRGRQDYVIFRVCAQAAYHAGVKFDKRGEYFVAREMPPEFLDVQFTLADYAMRQVQPRLQAA